MKAIILSAGQGKRLLPLTAKLPKCLLQVQGKTILEWQIDELHKCGIDTITVVTGYGHEAIDSLLLHNEKLGHIVTHYNPDFAKADNLVSCWKVRDQMNEDFILLNGDTLIESAVVKTLLASPVTPITVTINHKDRYDSDDMKVALSQSRLTRIGKDLPQEDTHGESIGMIFFRGDGPKIFRDGLENALKEPKANHRWYLSVINTIAQSNTVMTCSIKGLRWCEVDCPADLQEAQKVVSGFPDDSDVIGGQESSPQAKFAAL